MVQRMTVAACSLSQVDLMSLSAAMKDGWTEPGGSRVEPHGSWSSNCEGSQQEQACC